MSNPVHPNEKSLPNASKQRENKRGVWLGGLVTLVVCAVVSDRLLWQPGRVFGAAESVQIEEAQSLWKGTFQLSERRHDTAEFEGRVYSYFPPMYTFLAALFVPFFGGVPHLFFVVLAGVLATLAYLLFLRLTGSVAWAVVLSLGFVIGTSHWPVVDQMLRGARPYHVNHVLASIGVLLILLTLSSQRWFPAACLGLVLAGLSRQMTMAYALPLGWLAWQGARVGRGWAPLILATASVATVAGVTMAINGAKFANPLDSGYIHNYVGRDDAFAWDAREHGLFSGHYVLRNLYHVTIAPPQLHAIEMAGRREWHLRSDELGAGVFWTTPLLLFAVFAWRAIRCDKLKLALLGAVAAIFVALLLWHGTGSVQKGYHRYAMDFVPGLFFLLVPGCLATRHRRWLTVLAVSWSIFYFAVLLPLPNIRVW